jgi:hypothetical protein
VQGFCFFEGVPPPQETGKETLKTTNFTRTLNSLFLLKKTIPYAIMSPWSYTLSTQLSKILVPIA